MTGKSRSHGLMQGTDGLIKALAMVTTGDETSDETSGSSTSCSSLPSTMNLNSHYPASHELAPTMIHSSGGQALHHIPQHPSPPTSKRASPLPPLTDFLPPLLKQASKGGFGLSKIPQKTLHDNLQPVIRALEHLDAEALLDLATIKSNAPGCGPKVRNGIYCRPIIDEIEPSLNSAEYLRNGHSCVRYLHIAEVPHQYSIGIFVFGPYARIPLHDHPNMCVLSRVLYGDLQRQSLDLARDSDVDNSGRETNGINNDTAMDEDDTDCIMAGSTSSLGSFSTSTAWSFLSRFNSSRKSSFSSVRNLDSDSNQHIPSQQLPKGTKNAYKNGVDHLEAPAVTVLYPFEGNLHEFVAGEHGAAVLDVLLPPYDNEQNRDCTFYNITDVHPSSNNLMPRHGKEPCLIVPTGQPETFHCISGTYRDLGEEEDDSSSDELEEH